MKLPGFDGAFGALSIAILRGFLRDKASVFFALIFPLMFLVLFGGLFGDAGQSKVDLVQVGDVSVIDDLPAGAREAFEDTFKIEHSDDIDAAIEEVRKGDADVAVEMKGDTLVAHYTLTDQVKAGITQGALQAFVQGSNVALLAQAAGEPPTYQLDIKRVEDDSLDTIQFVTPGLLGWAVAMSAAFGAAATLQGWRQSKLLRRLQLAPVSTRTVVGARVTVAMAIAFVQMAIFLGIGAGAFGLVLTGSWWMSIPLLGRRHAVLHGDRTVRRRGHDHGRGRRQRRQLHRAADGVPQRLVLPARRGAGLAPNLLEPAAAQASQRGDARRDGARGRPGRRAGAARHPGGLRDRGHPDLRPAVPVGNYLSALPVRGFPFGVLSVCASRGGGALDRRSQSKRRQRSEVRAMCARSASPSRAGH